MDKKNLSIIIASVITIIFLFFAMRPGIFNMIGYAISILIFPENSNENLKYGKFVIFLFNIFCGVVLFYIVYKITKRVLK